MLVLVLPSRQTGLTVCIQFTSFQRSLDALFRSRVQPSGSLSSALILVLCSVLSVLLCSAYSAHASVSVLVLVLRIRFSVSLFVTFSFVSPHSQFRLNRKARVRVWDYINPTGAATNCKNGAAITSPEKSSRLLWRNRELSSRVEILLKLYCSSVQVRDH